MVSGIQWVLGYSEVSKTLCGEFISPTDLRKCHTPSAYHTIAKKIQELSARKIPLIAVVGEREKANATVNLRRLSVPEQEEIAFAQLEK
ncbi:MAG: His/Gly/Thr/Pro-type tRNA ligase C-terminal domain-containing protein [Brasilonema sp.]